MEQIRQDLTEQKEAASPDESSEPLFRAIVEEQADFICRCTGDGILTFANRSYCRFFNKRSDELTGHPFDPVLLAGILQAASAGRPAPAPGSPDTTAEVRMARADGALRWVQWLVHPLFDEEGRLAGFQTTGRDITERKGAESLLSVQYEVTLALAEAATVNEAMRRTLQAICQSLGWDLAILWRNERSTDSLRFEGIWHVPGVESVMVQHSLLPEMDLPGRVLRERKTVWIPEVGADRNGQKHSGFHAVLAFPARAGGSITAVIECFSRTPRPVLAEVVDTLEAIGHQVGNFRERKIAEEALKHAAEELEVRVRQRTEQLAGALEALSNSEMRFRAMFEGAPLGIALVNTAGLITERNPVLERMLEYPEGSLYGVRFDALIWPEDRAQASRYFQDLLDGKRSQYRVELRFLTTRGEPSGAP